MQRGGQTPPVKGSANADAAVACSLIIIDCSDETTNPQICY
jgi:hypothetical protein